MKIFVSWSVLRPVTVVKYLGLIIIIVIFVNRQVLGAEKRDIVLIGAGIMSATVASLVQEVDPKLNIEVYERLSDVALESSEAWNNAGTGHAGYCELNYTPVNKDGSIEIKKAVEINEAFELSKQFWAYQSKKDRSFKPDKFIHSVPHISFVWGNDNVEFLRKRHEKLSKHPLFQGMEYSEEAVTLKEWAPLVMKGRLAGQKLAATRFVGGTDIDFGTLTKLLFAQLRSAKKVRLQTEVQDFVRNADGTWTVKIYNLGTKKTERVIAKKLFIGAGGGALPLLQKTHIPQSRLYAGFPVGGAWFVSENEEVASQHLAKVYGKPAVGAPPMSVPHLDSRYIHGKRHLLFGPFALFSTKFLKQGSWLDIVASFKWFNMFPMIKVGVDNVPLTSYLVSQALIPEHRKFDALREYFPEANPRDWRFHNAGQRVQIIKKDPLKGGILQFGTEVVASDDGSVVALLGASPGASVSVQVALSALKKFYPMEMKSGEWLSKLREMIPSYELSLSSDPTLLNMIRKQNREDLKLLN